MELNWQNFTSEGRIASLFPEVAIKVGLEVSVSAATDKIDLTEDSEWLSDTWYETNMKNDLSHKFRSISIQNKIMKYKYIVKMISTVTKDSFPEQILRSVFLGALINLFNCFTPWRLRWRFLSFAKSKTTGSILLQTLFPFSISFSFFRHVLEFWINLSRKK